MGEKKGRLVYSTGPGGAAPAKRRGPAAPSGPRQGLPPQQQAPRVRRERGGRGGKTVTTVTPIVLTRGDAEALLGELKKACAAGGTLKVGSTPDGRPCFALEVQGDHADAICAALVERGYKAKRAGG